MMSITLSHLILEDPAPLGSDSPVAIEPVQFPSAKFDEGIIDQTVTSDPGPFYPSPWSFEAAEIIY